MQGTNLTAFLLAEDSHMSHSLPPHWVNLIAFHLIKKAPWEPNSTSDLWVKFSIYNWHISLFLCDQYSHQCRGAISIPITNIVS